MVYEWMIFGFLLTLASATHIRLLQCEVPDKPIGGDYGPKQDLYIPGDFIHYYCDVDTFIGGNYYRKCEDTGAWSGNTPVCDTYSAFSTLSQSSTKDYQSNAEFATDGDRETCSSTIGGRRDEWSGTFLEPGQLIRVMLFLPIGPAAFEVILVRANGQEIICGSHERNIDRYDWTFQNCAEPYNTGAVGLKIRSLSNEPLQICEIQAYVLTSPKCTDPRMPVENGFLSLNRKTAILTCHDDFVKSRTDKLECIREGEWSRKILFCYEPPWASNENNDEDNETATEKPRPENPDRERERITG